MTLRLGTMASSPLLPRRIQHNSRVWPAHRPILMLILVWWWLLVDPVSCRSPPKRHSLPSSNKPPAPPANNDTRPAAELQTIIQLPPEVAGESLASFVVDGSDNLYGRGNWTVKGQYNWTEEGSEDYGWRPQRYYCTFTATFWRLPAGGANASAGAFAYISDTIMYSVNSSFLDSPNVTWNYLGLGPNGRGRWGAHLPCFALGWLSSDVYIKDYAVGHVRADVPARGFDGFAVDRAGRALFWWYWMRVVPERPELDGTSRSDEQNMFVLRRLDLATGTGANMIVLNTDGLPPANTLMGVVVAEGGEEAVLTYPDYLVRVDVATGKYTTHAIGYPVMHNASNDIVVVGNVTSSEQLPPAGTPQAWVYDTTGGSLYRLYTDGITVDAMLCDPLSPSYGIVPAADAFIIGQAKHALKHATVRFCYAYSLFQTSRAPSGAYTTSTVMPLQLFSTSVFDNHLMPPFALALELATGSAFLVDRSGCSISRLDAATWDTASRQNVVGRVPGRWRPQCWAMPVDGPAARALIGPPGRLKVGSRGTLFFVEGNTYLRRITGASP